MLVEPLVFAAVGSIVGAVALIAFPGYFPPSRSLTVATAVIAALLTGLIARYAMQGALPGLSVAISAVGSALLVSVLARPERAGQRQAAARRRSVHRHGGQRRHRHRPA
ncbi:hypothetical protein [Kitasatospora sp. NPDC050543]|uniref:hypothetical protein n=1 Tax=Kitasatospora sp. NPDC050543 TaxID=3364054 RepID=UPI0037915A46